MPRLAVWFDRFSRSAFSFPLALIAALGLLVISELSYRHAVQSIEALRVQNSARVATHRLLLAVVDAESGQRGYLLTGRPEYLQPYRKAVADIRETTRALQQRYENETAQKAQLTRLLQLVTNKLSELETTLKLHTEGRDAAWRELIGSGIGREAMQAMRDAAEQLIASENEAIEAQREDIRETLQINRIGVGTVTAISLLAFFMYLRQSMALDQERQLRQQALQEDRDRLEAQVRERTADLTHLTQHLQSAREDEKSRLARELHDELGALLTAAKLDLARIRSRLGGAAPELTTRIEHLTATLNSGIALKRRIIEDLRPSALSNLGLVAALEILAREFEQRSGLKLQCALQALRLTPSCELTVYRLVQEALTNVAKYAKAREVRIALQPQGPWALVSVQDDGTGFDTSIQKTSAHGLLGMRYRVEAEGGRLQLHSTPGQGTRIEAVLPLRAEEPTPALADPAA
ncbi:CHASE3 domain-containing protein [Azohydromonas caseinilytica]|uniref:Histidine kinase n=1 Tax=Azohydromonas caseinilytica TaxID=2728836 RepID=A0A848F440_9BURK|nr:CHASE3 domain-containing protein [Azohydromonas caseinilytica]NML14152.1 histidine kinase [Azohydromonas caseinilytica]